MENTVDYTVGNLKWAEVYIKAAEIENMGISPMDIGDLLIN